MVSTGGLGSVWRPLHKDTIKSAPWVGVEPELSSTITRQRRGLNWRTNLYYIETLDFGSHWQTVDGQPLPLPLVDVQNPARVHDYESESQNVYLKDLVYDDQDRPVILYLTSRGYQSGPRNDPRTWTTARWTGERWEIRPAFRSDNNYDMGELWIDADGRWRVIAPTLVGPQPYNPGGEVALWISSNQGQSWRSQPLTFGSRRNHTYVRRPVNAHPDFYAFWADGHGRQPSESRLYFCDRDGGVRLLPPQMEAETETPALVYQRPAVD